MKKFFILALFSFFLSSFSTSSVDDVVLALKNGNASQIAKFFDNTIEITLPGKSNSYSKSQAQLVLRDFFIANVVKAFLVINKGDNAGSQYCIGSLQTKNGIYRTTIYCRLKGDKLLVQELRFEK